MRTVLLPILIASTLFACASPPSISPSGSSITPSMALESESVSTRTPTVAAVKSILIDKTPATVSYLLPPTVKHITETEAVIFFELSQPEDGILAYSLAESGTQEGVITFGTEAGRHQILIEGLQASEQYKVVIGVQEEEGVYRTPQYDGADWGAIEFTTLSGDYPLRVAVIGDAGLNTPVTRVMADMIVEQNPAFMIFTGDVVYNVGDYVTPFDAYAKRYFEPFSPVLKRMPVYTVVGNHDVEKQTYMNGEPFYYYVFPPLVMPGTLSSSFEERNQWYTMEAGDFKFIMLDTQTFYNEAGRTEQDEWLAKQLSDPQSRYKVPVFHIPPFTSGRHVLDGWSVRESWVPLFEQARVPLVLSGHDHNYQRIEKNGITYIVSGGGSSVLYEQTELVEGNQIFVRESHFVILDFYLDHITITSISAKGEILDTTTIVLD